MSTSDYSVGDQGGSHGACGKTHGQFQLKMQTVGAAMAGQKPPAQVRMRKRVGGGLSPAAASGNKGIGSKMKNVGAHGACGSRHGCAGITHASVAKMTAIHGMASAQQRAMFAKMGGSGGAAETQGGIGGSGRRLSPAMTAKLQARVNRAAKRAGVRTPRRMMAEGPGEPID